MAGANLWALGTRLRVPTSASPRTSRGRVAVSPREVVGEYVPQSGSVKEPEEGRVLLLFLHVTLYLLKGSCRHGSTDWV